MDKKRFTYLFFMQFFIITIWAQQPDIGIITDRLTNKQKEAHLNKEQLENDLATINNDGSWNDIDYNTVNIRFDAGKHLNRLLNMALGYIKIESPYQNSDAVLNKILLGLDFFFIKNPTSSNWWYIDIGAPQKYMNILLLLKGRIDKDKLLYYSRYLKDKTDNQAHKGKNRTWVSAITIGKGCIEDNPDLVSIGFKSIASTIKIVDYHEIEGIKIDNSIHQHRPQLYSGGYGMSFISDLAEYINLSYGTGFAKLFTPEKIKIISNVMLGGQLQFGYKKTFDFGTVGRGISRIDGITNVSPDLLDLMAKIDPSNASLYISWKAHIDKDMPFPERKNKHFWKSDIMTHHGDKYYMSAKVISTRTNGTEMLNGENLRGYYLPLGATNILRSGKEYKNIFPIWDWTRIPGTTAVSSQSTAMLSWYHFGSNKFAGGVSNSKNGCIAFEHVYNGVQARKAYFFIGDAMLCLGTGITAYRTNSVVTTINQCYTNGDIYLSDNKKVILYNNKKKLFDNLDWAYHDSIGYIFPDKNKITLQNQKQTGSWSLLSESESKEELSGKVFSLWFEHGEEPQSETYSYIIIPDKSLQETQEIAKKHGFVIVKNDKNIQAVYNKNVSAIVFYKAGSVHLTNDLQITVDKAAIILIEESKNGYELSVSDPLYSESELNITFNRKLNGDNVHIDGTSSLIKIDLPQGEYLGSSLCKYFTLIK